MKSVGVVSVAVLLLAVRCAHGGGPASYNKMKPSQWVSSSQLEQVPSIEDVSIEKLENMSVEKGTEIIDNIYHLSQINHNLRPNFVPSMSNIPVYVYKSNGQKIATSLDKLATVCMQQANFGQEEVTIYITGYAANTESIKKANRYLIEAYLQRYNNWKPQLQKYDYSGEKMVRTSSEEDDTELDKAERPYGDLVVIDLGAKLNSFKRLALLDTKETGAMIASVLMEVVEKCNVPQEIIHIVAQGIAAHVAGAAGNEYSRRTGRKIRRITALDPSKIYARDPQTLIGLSRGDAEFVDAIHTNVYGLGTINRVGDVDFYPNGLAVNAPGAKNIVECSMRATRYYAESVRPGNEHNFPAVAANSLMEYQNNDGYGKRVYMGIDTDYDVRGDYMLEVNEKSLFGKKTVVQKQNSYHGMHKPWKNLHTYE